MATLNCPTCGTPYRQGDLICMTCGTNLARVRPAPEAGRRRDEQPPYQDQQQYGQQPQQQPQPQYPAPPHEPSYNPQNGGYGQQQPPPYEQQQPSYEQPPNPYGQQPPYIPPGYQGQPPPYEAPPQQPPYDPGYQQQQPPYEPPQQYGQQPPYQQPDPYGGGGGGGQGIYHQEPQPQYGPPEQPPRVGPPPPPRPAREETLLPPEQRRPPTDSTAAMCPYCEAVLSSPAAAQCDNCLRPIPRHQPPQGNMQQPPMGMPPAPPTLRLMFPTGELHLQPGQHLVLGRDAGQSPVSGTFTQYDNVSRRHTTVWLDQQGTAWVRDERSTNGTFVNDERLPPGVEAPLHDGDALRLAADVTGQVRLG